ncbi:hypothetical protein [Streptomyces californicus]|uniref:hypothetical protein n=1 Tax=Streptomyces californicus TaxID=67351 RepID=UPI0004C0CAAD|nr:hypothetical protein [Streptomyces californicus]QRV59428.1 hypothetical protein I6J40_34785 [Streptomyces californicus]
MTTPEYAAAWPDGTVMRETPTPHRHLAEARVRAHQEMGGTLAHAYLVQRPTPTGKWAPAPAAG